jgi:Flp pilus assembly protein TadD
LKECRMSQELDPRGDHQRDTDTLYWAGKDDRAIALAQMLLQTDPNDGFLHHALYRYYSRKGMYKEAATEAERVLALFGDPDGAGRVHRALIVSGGRVALKQTARELERWFTTRRAYVPGNLAALYAILDDKDRAFYWLEEAYKHHHLSWLTTDIPLESLRSERMFDSLRSDPRYEDLVRRIGLPQ